MPPQPSAYGSAPVYQQWTLPPGVRMSSRWKRLGNALLASLLMVLTLIIGYMIWAAIVYGRGQTPAKQLLKMYVLDEQTGRPATWGTMFVRGFVIDVLLNNITCGVFGIVSACWIFGGGDRPQRLTDKMVHTIVVDAPNGLSI